MPRALILASPAPLDGIVEADHHRGVRRHEGFDQQDQQLARHGPGRPRRPVEDTVEGAKVGIVFAPEDAQRRRDGSPAWRQDDAGEQHQDVRPGRTGEQIREAHEPRQETFRQRRPRRAGEKMGVLHPIGRIGALNRGNIASVRQIEIDRLTELAFTRRNRHTGRYGQTRHDACPDRCSVHAARRGTEPWRICDHRSSHCEPNRTAASHHGH